MYCSHCGKQIEDVDVCPLCGCYARNYTQPAAPVAPPPPRPQVAPKPRVVRNGKGSALRVFGKIFAVFGILVNFPLLYALDRSYSGYSAHKIGSTFFNDMYYFIALMIMLVTMVGAGCLLFARRRVHPKLHAVTFGILGVIALWGGIYGFLFEYYSHEALNTTWAIGGTVLVAISAILCILAIFTRKNILNLFSIIANFAGTWILMLFFSTCLINSYYRAEELFLLSCLDIAGMAFLLIFHLGTYNSDMKFDAKYGQKAVENPAPVTEPVAVAEPVKAETSEEVSDNE